MGYGPDRRDELNPKSQEGEASNHNLEPPPQNKIKIKNEFWRVWCSKLEKWVNIVVVWAMLDSDTYKLNDKRVDPEVI